MTLSKYYIDVRSTPLASILSDIKNAVAAMNSKNDKVRYIYELVCEELITNLYHYAQPLEQCFDISLTINNDPDWILLKEIGVKPIDEYQISERIQAGQANIDQLNSGGLGIALIIQLTKAFNYRHDAATATNIFEVVI